MVEEEFSYSLKIPRERVGVLIGKSGEVKKEIEQATNTKLTIDSQEGEVLIASADGLNLYEAREVIRAIARGFNPKVALQLLKTDFTLDVIAITSFIGKSKTAFSRLKGRVIGSEGKAKRELERLTDTQISVYGKTVAIIGEVEDVSHARKAIENLLKGSPHSGVYKLLEKRRRWKKQHELISKDLLKE